MPRDIDDEPVARPTAKGKKRLAAAEAESGPWKALGITFGCVLVAFAGIMIFVMSKAPNGGGPVAGDPPGDTGNRVPPVGIPKTPPVVPEPAPVLPEPPTPPANLPPSTDLVPDDWTPPAWSRPEVDISPGRKMTATPTLGIEPLKGIDVRAACYLDGPRLLFVQGVADSDNAPVIRFRDVASDKDLPSPKLSKPGMVLYSLEASPDQKALFIHTQIDRVLHRFDVARRVWESAPLECAGQVAVVSADRLLAVQGRPGRLRLLKWQGDGKTPVPTAEAADRGLDSGTTHAFDPLSRTAFTAAPAADGKGKMELTRYAVGGRELKPIRTYPFTLADTPGWPAAPKQLHLAWNGERLFTGNRTIDLTTGAVTERPFQTITVAVTPTALLDANRTFYDARTGGVVAGSWLATNTPFVSASGTACWVQSGTYPSHVFTCHTLGAEGGGGAEPPPVSPPPANPFAKVQITELATLPASGQPITAFKFSDKHNLLLYTDVTGTTVVDTKTGQPLPQPKLEGKARLRSADLAPDQTAAFASDGQNLHRLDLATRKWEARPNVGTRILALDGSTALVQVKPSNPATYALVRWGPAEVAELSRTEWPYLYELGYDPVAEALFALYAKVNNSGAAVLEKYTLKDAEFVSEWSKKSGGATPGVTFRPLTGDGKYFFQGQRAWATIADERPITQYPEPLVGATRDALVGASGKLYAAGNVPAVIGILPQPADAVAASGDGQTVWVASRTAKKFLQYKIDPSAKKQ